MPKRVVRQRDALRGTAATVPIAPSNTFTSLQTDGDDSDDGEDLSDNGTKHDRTNGTQKKKTVRRT